MNNKSKSQINDKILSGGEMLSTVISLKSENPKITKKEIIQKTGFSENQVRWALRVMTSAQATNLVIGGKLSLNLAYKKFATVADESDKSETIIKTSDAVNENTKTPITPASNEFSNIDCSNLEKLETLINNIGNEPILAGFAISKIIENDKYAEKASSFKEYCRKFLSFSYRRAMQLSEAYDVYQKNERPFTS